MTKGSPVGISQKELFATMQPNDRNAKRLVVILGGFAFVLLIAISMILLVPRKPLATVAFSGYRVGGDGKQQAVFTITNNGRGTLRRWDFYRVAIMDDRDTTEQEHHLGPDTILAPGQSEQVTIDAPSTKSAWQATFHFTDYNVVEEAAYENSGAGELPSVISEKLIDGKVDLKVSTGWIEPSD